MFEVRVKLPCPPSIYCFVALKVTRTVADRSFQLSPDIVKLRVFVTTGEPSSTILSVKLPWSVPP